MRDRETRIRELLRQARDLNQRAEGLRAEAIRLARTALQKGQSDWPPDAPAHRDGPPEHGEATGRSEPQHESSSSVKYHGRGD